MPIGFWKNASSFFPACAGSMPSMVRCAGSEPNGRLDVTSDGVVAVLLHRFDVLVDERLDELGVVPHAPERVEHAVRVERGAVVEGDALAEREAPGGVVDRAPGLGQGRHELRVVGDVHQRIEHVPVHRGGGDRVVVGRIERQHALGEPGDQLTAPLALRAGGARKPGRGQAGRAQGQELPSANRVGRCRLAHGGTPPGGLGVSHRPRAVKAGAGAEWLLSPADPLDSMARRRQGDLPWPSRPPTSRWTR